MPFRQAKPVAREPFVPNVGVAKEGVEKRFASHRTNNAAEYLHGAPFPGAPFSPLR